MTATCEPIFKLLKKDQGCVLTDDCQREFESIKDYLVEPPTLLPLIEGRPLIMYLTVMDNSIAVFWDIMMKHEEKNMPSII